MSGSARHLELPPELKPYDLGGADEIPALLRLSAPPFVSIQEAFTQINAATARAKQLGAQAILVEQHYVDRDHIEDHAVFYSKSLHSYDNFCKRVSFFKNINKDELTGRLVDLLQRVNHDGRTYIEECERFSREHFVGFIVVRPLPGTPLGRSVLPPLPDDLACAPPTTIHILGLRLSTTGVPFQEQDVAVSACATTAVWSSLQTAAQHEPISWATPALITRLASEHYLPHGRSMPSDGLTTGQMCQAMQALGVAPSLLRAEEFDDSRGCIHAALKSGVAPVLILEPPAGGGDSHAVCATGMRIDTNKPLQLERIDNVGDAAAQMSTLLVHDDRTAPYLECEFRRQSGSAPYLYVPNAEDDGLWRLSQILVPAHPKIRLSFLVLRRLALRLVLASYEAAMRSKAGIDSLVVFDLWVERGYLYLEATVRNCRAERIPDVLRLGQSIPLPRYISVVRLTGPVSEPVDVLLDTTATEKNLHMVAVLTRGPLDDTTAAVAERLLDVCGLGRDRLISA